MADLTRLPNSFVWGYGFSFPNRFSDSDSDSDSDSSAPVIAVVIHSLTFFLFPYIHMSVA